MKQSDFFTMLIVALAGMVGAFVVCQTLFGDPKQAVVKHNAMSSVLSKDLVQPDSEIFNATAINPTIEVYVAGCEDIDQNGILDEMELEECAQKQGQTVSNEPEPEPENPEG